ncbi:MAG: bifunctional aspartate transaminase/aspartate 4-decarboxylase [Deltaproteobacteria bacterium]|nr:bifunctional aspartate transaminase/aspartate 4-decarboxylase [Deltaproteobacteria bacterium]MBW2595529.1 bifunctional aspartate transaminase/aspartate 4-decarboxylase [Deltaproteobacteria bacterium]MBW2649904.1 bifunctional aspartate transaminase/aspartate 4-decarboxylase [Deltaproteobacteria bacterium]
MNRATEEKSYEQLSPFELKNKLMAMAEKRSEKLMLNAGRGNPNWVATEARHAFFLLGNFAMGEAYRVMSRPGLAGAPSASGSAGRFREFCLIHSETRGAQFLADALKHVTTQMDLNGDEFVGEMVDGILGDHYPTPDRVLVNTEKIVRAYLDVAMCDSRPPEGIMDIFLTEGGTAAMTYIFNTLRENHLVKKGDKIALGTPIFTPYLEIPVLNDYEMVVVDVEQNEDKDWQYTDAELEKLADPDVKAFFLVNPSNPSSVSIAEESLYKIADLVRDKRKDLIILTDDVYGTFVNGFRSLAAIAPKNTILVYSYSKYFGATGWRLGAIGISRDNVMDEMIAALPEDQKKELHERYVTISRDPDSIKLIDRLVADSRTVALNHTAGLSTPQQVMMVLFSLQELLDLESRLYRKEVQDVVRERYNTLYAALGEEPVELTCYAKYYATIDIHKLAVKRHGEEFAKWLKTTHEPIDFVWRLAAEKDVVLMDGGGFDAPEMSVRVSLANLNKADYDKIGHAVSDLLEKYVKEWKAGE